jgi:uncharacterized protein with FMN-binding domain
VRTESKIVYGLVGLSALGSSIIVGMPKGHAQQTVAAVEVSPAQPELIPAPTLSDTPQPTDTTAPSDATTTSPAEPAAPVTSEPAAPADSTQTPAPADPVPAEPVATTLSATGDAVGYRYGVVQLAVTATDGHLDAIDIVQVSVDGEKYRAVPGELVQRALSSQGTGFANVSGATFTSNAFRQALASALSGVGL